MQEVSYDRDERVTGSNDNNSVTGVCEGMVLEISSRLVLTKKLAFVDDRFLIRRQAILDAEVLLGSFCRFVSGDSIICGMEASQIGSQRMARAPLYLV